MLLQLELVQLDFSVINVNWIRSLSFYDTKEYKINKIKNATFNICIFYIFICQLHN